MRDLLVVGLDVDGRHLIMEAGDDAADTFRIRIDDRLRAAVRGDQARSGQTQMDIEVRSVLRPKDIQSRIRAGASVEQLAAATGADPARIDRFAHPVLLERARAAELATAAHPVLADGPAVLTLLESVTSALVARGLDPNATRWDAWRNEDGRWTVRLEWQAGRSDNRAHFRFVPGAHGGTVTALDEIASELVDPHFDRPLRPVAPVAQLDFEVAPAPVPAPAAVRAPEPTATSVPTDPAATAPAAPAEPPRRSRTRRAKPAVPAWEDVLLGVRSSGDR